MTRANIEKILAAYLDERYYIMQIMKGGTSNYLTNRLLYEGAARAVAQIAVLDRNEDGKHYVELY